jgi:hypothetical protein
LNWAMEQPGVAKAQLDIFVGCTSFPEKMEELITGRVPESLAQ